MSMPAARRPFSLAALVLAAALAACATPPEENRFAQLTYDHLPAIKLDVAGIRVVDAYQPPLEPPYIEHEVPVKPADAAQNWARDRLVATGEDRTAVFTVETASITEERLETEGGISGLFTSEPTERYEARIRVRLQVGGTGDEIAVEARRTTSVMEGASLNDRERAWYELVEKTMNDLNAQLETSIRKHLARYLEA